MDKQYTIETHKRAKWQIEQGLPEYNYTVWEKQGWKSNVVFDSSDKQEVKKYIETHKK